MASVLAFYYLQGYGSCIYYRFTLMVNKIPSAWATMVVEEVGPPTADEGRGTLAEDKGLSPLEVKNDNVAGVIW
ncbi:hypothetical protein KIF59_21245 [Enterobacter cloacae subsp. cloacae]|nr:hypothetical protein [Enterobacter cloacae subsp. cloacae]